METTQSLLPSAYQDGVEKAFELFEQSTQINTKITLAYSGGKDSTLLAVVFYEWLKLNPELNLDIRIMHNDTSSEIDTMEDWAMDFITHYKHEIEKNTNSKVEIQVRRPNPIDTFYWRAIIRGYPAPSFNFRWCVHLLKEKPANIDSIDGNIMTGLRDQESSARSYSMKKKYGGSCGATPGGCMTYYYSSEGNGNKIAPFREWSDSQVWTYLLMYKKSGDFDISPLFGLYHNVKVRYGCWHCTLASVQWGLHAPGKQLVYFEAVRVLYRKFSDLHYLRKKKNTGYSNLGPLNATGRNILLNLISIAEDLSGIKLYGLDNNKVGDYTLRQVLYELPPDLSTEVINRADPKINKNRYVKIARIRDSTKGTTLITRAIRDVKKAYVNEKSYKALQQSGRDPFETILSKLENKINA